MEDRNQRLHFHGQDFQWQKANKSIIYHSKNLLINMD